MTKQFNQTVARTKKEDVKLVTYPYTFQGAAYFTRLRKLDAGRVACPQCGTATSIEDLSPARTHLSALCAALSLLRWR